MTLDEKRIALAEEVGWKNIEVEDGQTFSEPKCTAYRKMWVFKAAQHTKTLRLPDYFSDLNAALTLVEHAETLGWMTRMDNIAPLKWKVEMWTTEMSEPVSSSHRSLPTAICNAFARAFEIPGWE